jgi:hypothetical protein
MVGRLCPFTRRQLISYLAISASASGQKIPLPLNSRGNAYDPADFDTPHCLRYYGGNWIATESPFPAELNIDSNGYAEFVQCSPDHNLITSTGKATFSLYPDQKNPGEEFATALNIPGAPWTGPSMVVRFGDTNNRFRIARQTLLNGMDRLSLMNSVGTSFRFFPREQGIQNHSFAIGFCSAGMIPRNVFNPSMLEGVWRDKATSLIYVITGPTQGFIYYRDEQNVTRVVDWFVYCDYTFDPTTGAFAITEGRKIGLWDARLTDPQTNRFIEWHFVVLDDSYRPGDMINANFWALNFPGNTPAELLNSNKNETDLIKMIGVAAQVPADPIRTRIKNPKGIPTPVSFRQITSVPSEHLIELIQSDKDQQ